MALPLATTAVTIERPETGIDPFEDQLWSVVDSSVVGTISGSSGSGRDVGGAQQTLSARLFVNEGTDVRKADRVTDEVSGDVWRVLWVRKRYELGLGHIVAGLEAVEDAADGS